MGKQKSAGEVMVVTTGPSSTCQKLYLDHDSKLYCTQSWWYLLYLKCHAV